MNHKQVESPQVSLAVLSALLLGCTVFLNVLWLLDDGDFRILVTILAVSTFAFSSFFHAWSTLGRNFAFKLVAICFTLTFAIEAIGASTGFPFGNYSYGPDLGKQLLGVPLLIPAAWFMMLYPSFIIGRLLTHNYLFSTLIGAWLMATWDLYLDPQMVNVGYWTWFNDGNVATTQIPLSNFFGWFFSSTVIIGLINLLPVTKSQNPHIRIPVIAVFWIWIGGFVANVVWFKPFLDQPLVGISGAVGMAVVLIPLGRVLWSQRS